MLLYIFKYSILDGSKSIIDKVIITPDEKAKNEEIILFLFPFMYIEKYPIIVDKPAIKLIIIPKYLFILKYI